MTKQFKITINLLFHGGLGASKKITANLDNWRQQFDELNKSKQFTPKQSYPIGERIYFDKLSRALTDLKITEQTKKELADIKSFFSLADSDVKEIKADLSQTAVTKLVADKFKDSIFTAEEKEGVYSFAQFLELNQATVNSIVQKTALTSFQSALTSATQDKKLSPKEETQLEQLLKNLQLGDDIEKIGLSKSKMNDLIFFKLLWQAENGILAPYPNPPIGLQKTEECYYAFSATLLEKSTVTTGYEHIGHGFSIPITKNIRYRAGHGYSVPMKKTVVTKYPGHIFLTDRRIIFDGGEGSFTVPFTKLISFHPYSDGIEFVISNWVYSVMFTPASSPLKVNQQIDLFCSGLTSCIRYNSNPDDPIYQQALKEVKENDQLIKFDNATN